MWVYSVTAKTLWKNTGDVVTTRCSSGHDGAKDISQLDDMKDIGPIPRGTWQVLNGFDSVAIGAKTIPLLPLDHAAKKRAGFTLHGNMVKMSQANGIAMPLSIRNKIDKSKDKTILVIE